MLSKFLVLMVGLCFLFDGLTDLTVNWFKSVIFCILGVLLIIAAILERRIGWFK